MNCSVMKFVIGMVLFATWVALVLWHPSDPQQAAAAGELLTSIKVALGGLGGFHLQSFGTDAGTVVAVPAVPAQPTAVATASVAEGDAR